MLEIQTPLIGKTYLVISIIVSAMLLGPFTSRKIASVLPGRKKKQGDIMDTHTVMKQAALSTAIYLLAIIAVIIAVMVGVFMFYLVAKDVTLSETFYKTLETFNTYFWMNGQLTFAYSPIILSSIVLLFVVLSYAWGNSDFVDNIAFAKVNNDFMINKKKDQANQNITQTYWFRKHYMLLIFIASLFIYTIIFVPIWSTDKALYVKCVSLLLLILISSMAALHKWWLMFIVYLFIAVGYVTSPQ